MFRHILCFLFSEIVETTSISINRSHSTGTGGGYDFSGRQLGNIFQMRGHNKWV